VDLKHRKADTLAPTEKEFVMAMAARKIEAEFQMQESTALEKKVDRIQEDVAALEADVKVLRSDVDHLQEDVTDIKADVRQLSAGLTAHRIETEKSFAKVREDMKDGFAALRAEIASSRIEMKESFEKIRTGGFTQVAWIVGTVIAAVGTTVGAMKFFAAT
jgi:predicted  nucleic acid-binding Zn-ribbon protein